MLFHRHARRCQGSINWQLAGDWSGIVTDIVYPAYLDGADDTIKTNWVNWAVQYNAGTNADYEAAFLLGISPATAIPAGAAMLKVVCIGVRRLGFNAEAQSTQRRCVWALTRDHERGRWAVSPVGDTRRGCRVRA